MKFLEYQVKERFRAAGVPVPDGRVVRTGGSDDELAISLILAGRGHGASSRTI